MPTNPASPESISFPGIPSQTQAVWKQLISNNISDLSSSKTYSKLSEKLARLASTVDGIGYESIRRTIEWFIQHNDNIDLEDNCYICLLTPKIRKMLKKQDITNSEKLWSWIAKEYPSISEKKELEKISYLNTHLNNKL